MRRLNGLAVAVMFGCAASGATESDDGAELGPPLVEAPLAPLPARLSVTGYFGELSEGGDWDPSLVAPEAIGYEPAHPLWTNGSAKTRHALLPPGATIDNSDPMRWEFPIGTLVFKTFTFATPDGIRPVETRLIRRSEEGWDYAVYVWEGDDAYLRMDDAALRVEVVDEGERFVHEVPGRNECRACHATAASPLIGLTDEQLSISLRGATVSQRDDWFARGILAFADADPSDPGRDPESAWVASYLHGNCAHCHWADGVPTPLDLTRSRAIESIVDQPTMAISFPSGLRVAPGAPERSLLLTALAASNPSGVRPMPPIGVQRVDEEAAERLRRWIENLPTEDP
ncbi:MAG: hypothetical protein JJ863_05975 [Deltaproteobacteria bacterium]|nr:hypothetical protein [Deltaproteobacteria bacterium]